MGKEVAEARVLKLRFFVGCVLARTLSGIAASNAVNLHANSQKGACQHTPYAEHLTSIHKIPSLANKLHDRS